MTWWFVVWKSPAGRAGRALPHCGRERRDGGTWKCRGGFCSTDGESMFWTFCPRGGLMTKICWTIQPCSTLAKVGAPGLPCQTESKSRCFAGLWGLQRPGAVGRHLYWVREHPKIWPFFHAWKIASLYIEFFVGVPLNTEVETLPVGIAVLFCIDYLILFVILLRHQWLLDGVADIGGNDFLPTLASLRGSPSISVMFWLTRSTIQAGKISIADFQAITPFRA